MKAFRRLYWKLNFLWYYAESLNRRAEVENELIQCAVGKRAPLTKEDYFRLAYKLGNSKP